MSTPRNATQKAEDVAFIANLRLRRVTYKDCLELMNARPHREPMSWASVRRIAKEAEDMWKKDAIAAIETGKAEMLAEIELVRQEAWALYEESKKSKTVKRAEKAGAGDGREGSTKQIVTVEERLGDVNALKLVLEAQERKAKLLGLDAAQKQELSGPGGTPLGIGTPKLTVIVNTPVDDRPWHEKVAAVTGRRIDPIPELEG